MKKSYLMAIAFVVALSGCSTKCVTNEYVDDQLRPVQQQVTALEKRVGALEGKTAAMEMDLRDVRALAASADKKADDALANSESAMRRCEEKLMKKMKK